MTISRTLLAATALVAFAACRHEAAQNIYLSDTFALQLTSQKVDSITGATVSPEFASFASPRVLMGRFFVPADFEPSAAPTVVLSYELWSGRFGSERRIIGAQARVNNHNVTVVGVMAQGFDVPNGAQLWVPGPTK